MIYSGFTLVQIFAEEGRADKREPDILADLKILLLLLLLKSTEVKDDSHSLSFSIPGAIIGPEIAPGIENGRECTMPP